MKWHIIPVNDLIKHKENEKCWCSPRVKVVNNSKIIIHNSADGREYIEKEIAEFIKKQ